jgi:hypothetical protein
MKFYEDDGYLLRRSPEHVAERFLTDEKRWDRTTDFNFMTEATPIPRDYAVKMLPEGVDASVLNAPMTVTAK